ncbi:hypothetical protein EHI45_24940 [Rhizobium leguminosarum]|nr:hypothetical protein EHI45_24940 [Rhizobium leguminosarum]
MPPNKANKQFQQKCAAVLRPELRENKKLEHSVLPRRTECSSPDSRETRHRRIAGFFLIMADIFNSPLM